MVFLNQISATRIKICQWRKSNSLKKGRIKSQYIIHYSITIACCVYRRSTRLWHWQLLSLALYTEDLPGYDIDNYYRLLCIQKVYQAMTLTITIACFVYRKHDDNVHYQPAAYCTCAQRLALICYNLILLLKMFYRHTIFFVFQIFAAICLTMCPQVLRCYETL